MLFFCTTLIRIINIRLTHYNFFWTNAISCIVFIEIKSGRPSMMSLRGDPSYYNVFDMLYYVDCPKPDNRQLLNTRDTILYILVG